MNGDPSGTAPGGQPKKRGFNYSVLWEAVFVAFLALVVFWAAGRIDLVEKSFGFARKYEHWELDEIITLSFFFMFYFMVLALRKWRQTVQANHDLQKANQELQEAAKEIKALRGIIPICANCKSIRDDQGYWQKVEEYIRDRADVKFTHGLCPDCFVKLYPDLKLPKDKLSERSGQFDGNDTETN